MNICMITSAQFPPEEGIGNYVYGLSKKLIENGHKVTVITRGSLKYTQIQKIDEIEIIKVFYLPLYPFYLYIHGFFLKKVLKHIKKRCDIIHIHSPLCPEIKTKLPIIATIHTPMIADSRSIEIKNFQTFFSKLMAKKVSYPLEKRLIANADTITVVSKSVKSDLFEYGIMSKKILVVGNGVNENEFKPKEGITKENWILFTGRLAYRKGLFDLIECARIVQNFYPDYKFLIVGKGPLYSKLIGKVREHDLQNNIFFMGYLRREDLIDIYNRSKIFLLPSHYEGLPTVLLEAMACGLPVIATEVSGNQDVIEKNYNGILIPPKNPEIMANAILQLIRNPELRNYIGVNARKTIENKYSWDKIVKTYLECYTMTLEKRK